MDIDAEIAGLLADRAATMADFVPDFRPLKIYAIFRNDIGMDTGKLIAQCGHAYTDAHDTAKIIRPELTSQYRGTGHGTKISMYAKNLHQLLRAYKEARLAGLPCVLVIDRGHVIPGTPFDGNPIITAVGIGPVYQEEVEHITKRYTMVK